MAELSSIPWFLAAWRNGTRNLNGHQKMVYFEVLMEIYSEIGPVRIDPVVLARLLGWRTKTVREALAVLVDHHKLIQPEQGLYYSRKCDDVIKEIIGHSERAKRAANARWEQRKKSVPTADPSSASAAQTRSSQNIIEQPIKSQEKRRTAS